MHRLLTGALRVEEITVAIADLPDRLQGTKIVQLSDLHYDGIRLSEALLSEAIAASNQVEPDLVVVTGDLVTDDPAPIHNLTLRLKTLQSRHGIFVSLGNHDHKLPGAKEKIIETLTTAGIQVLWDQIAYPLGKELAVIGLGDFWSGDFKPAAVMSQVDTSTPRIVLSHNPDTAEILQQWRVDLQLSGHTHGGQMVLPKLGNLSIWYDQMLHPRIPKKVRKRLPILKKYQKVVRHWEWVQGLHRVGNNLLYVNRGLGTYLPGRLFCPPEVTVITLVVPSS